MSRTIPSPRTSGLKPHQIERLRRLCGLLPGEERAIPHIHPAMAECTSRPDKMVVIKNWWQLIRQQAPAAATEPTPDLTSTIMTQQGAPNLGGTKVEGLHPAMFLGVSDTTNWEALEDAEALAAATTTTKDEQRKARGRDLRDVQMPLHAAVDTLKTFAIVC